jgi:predicted phage tail protein
MLKTIKLYGDLREITGHSELDAHVNSVGDSIRFLLMNWPQLEAHMNTRHYQVLTDGNEIEENQIHYPVAEEIKIVPVIAGAGGSTGRILLGAALIGVAIASGGAAFGAGGGLGFGSTLTTASGATAFSAAALAGNIGIGLVLSGVSELLFPVPKPEKFENDQDPRISFDFGGTPNTSRAGTTHPIVYGEIFTGSTVISMNLTTDQVTA